MLKSDYTALVEKRLKWEALRKDFASKFAFTMPLSLPKKAETMSNYALSRDSILSDKELSSRNFKRKELFRIMRETRTLFSKFDRSGEPHQVIMNFLSNTIHNSMFNFR